ncbi:sigma-54 dependent transcriptional regulator [Pseudodesulfovibrio thermohalotolerans]|uniref:sigma-54-dependent transcriptional regulator n=1 Tax=Pseudodesulfovibrio thermohalotolerans TaxID=2880651 RepID=UPI002442C274|nr:sigma-54 dependent transcriptional regulator [Pseudodesulfovibrio thermohalotolerans]WFS61421.1 sigma-54 dependent transcriptional regulator [Pseudodesulfovibrio thermohalotolerans]
MADILIIDDDLEVCETMESLISRLPHECASAHTLDSGLRMMRKKAFDVVFLDVRLPDGNGLGILPDIMALPDPPEVIILTGKGDPDGAELAIRGGVWDYLLKPSSIREISLTLGRALKYHEEKRGRDGDGDLEMKGVVGESPIIKTSFNLLSQAARSESNVLITGETGTGKELFASTIHANSKRKTGNFVVVDCAGLTESLLESTLYGHRKGAFTGAQNDRIGLVKLADGGTLFLDEVGEMPLSMQKAFLRVLQERTFRPVGDTREQTSDFRLVAATNRDLDDMVEKGTFRSDLLYRLKTMHIHLPPLRERPEDIKSLATYRVNQLCRQYSMPLKSFGSDFHPALENYDWPGNVRELFNILERAVVTSGTEKTLYAMHLPRELRIRVAKEQIERMTNAAPEEEARAPRYTEPVRKIGQDIFEDIFEQELPTLRDFKSTAEKVYLGELIRQCDGDLSRILEVSKLSRSHFYGLLKKYGLSL